MRKQLPKSRSILAMLGEQEGERREEGSVKTALAVMMVDEEEGWQAARRCNTLQQTSKSRSQEQPRWSLGVLGRSLAIKTLLF